MTYQALARKWRPQDFASVVGQEPIVTALRNALTEGRIAQAYLFSGIRGVGKTSVARILAKALNCENGPDGGPAADPCNECVACAEITRGSDLDVLEVDAATYSKVEQVRELNESLKYGPARDRYKVVVLDEVHRLSRQAFDALLKIVEEPPPRLVFVFATTEIDSVPATILSRCQEYRFRRVPTATVAEYLRTVAAAEGIEASDAALFQLARAGEGSVRDAVALLDQLATYGQGEIGEEDAVRVLGGVDLDFFAGLLTAIRTGDRGEVARLAAEVESAGWDPRHVHAAFLDYCRAALRLAAGAAPERVDLPPAIRDALAEEVPEIGYENLLRLTQQLLSSEATVRRSEAAGLALELAWLRAAELPHLVQIEELLAGDTDEGRREPPSAPPRRTPPSGRGAAPERPPAPADEPASEPSPPESSADADADAAAAAVAAGHGAEVARLLTEVSRRKVALAAHLGEAQALELDDQGLRIVAPPGDTWLERALEREGNRSALEAALEAACGGPAGWRLEAGEEAPGNGPEPQAADAVDDAAAKHPTVQTVLDIFGGRIEGIEENATDKR